MRPRLSLERIAELTSEDLGAVVGAGSLPELTYYCPVTPGTSYHCPTPPTPRTLGGSCS